MSREETQTVALNNYETVFIAQPEIPADQVDPLLAKIKQVITSHQGSLTAEDRWGRRRMAYPIQGHREGFYVVMTFSAEPTVVSALEHFYNVTDVVIRHLIFRIIKKNKKFAPRRERPAGAAEGHRPSGRWSGPSRPRHENRPTTSPSAASVAPAAPKAEAVPGAAPEGGTPK